VQSNRGDVFYIDTRPAKRVVCQGADSSVENKLGAGTSAETALKVEELWATMEGARMRYLRAGSGPPLILLHGLLGYSFSWRFNIPALAQHFTVYAVDQLGVGFSERPPGLDGTLRATAGRMLRFLDHINASSCDLLGTSHGGAVAMMTAAFSAQRGGPRIRRLVLAAPANPWSQHGRRLAPFLSSPPVSTVLHSVAPFAEPTHRFFLRRLYGDKRRIRPGTLEGYSAPFRIPGTLAHGLGVLRSWTDDLMELARAIPSLANIPTLLIWGSRDPAVYPSSAEPLQRQFRHCELVIMKGVGHLPYEEKPEEFNAAVSDFLQRDLPGGSPIA